jgi:hypothetical protein
MMRTEMVLETSVSFIHLTRVIAREYFIEVLGSPIKGGGRSEAKALIACTLRSWVRIPLKAWMFVLLFLCCDVL